MTAKPTLLVLTSTFPRNDQDYEPRFVADLCLHLKSEFRVVVLTQSRPESSAEENSGGLLVRRFRYAPRRLEVLSETGGIANCLSQKPWTWLLVPLLVSAQILAVKRAIERYDPDIIHAHWLLPQALSTLAGMFLARRKLPLVTTSHGADIYGLKGTVLKKVKARTIRATDVFCVVSSAMKRHVLENMDVDQSQIEVSPMGADLLSVFTPGTRECVNTGEILYVGRLVRKKGVEHLIVAIGDLLNRGYEFSLKIIGYGPEEAGLKSLTRELGLDHRITFTGSLLHSEIADCYRQAEMCVLPFVEAKDGDIEGLGLVAVEAMGCKCPVIVGDVPAVRDLVVDGENGLVCDPTSTPDLCAKIIALHENQELRTHIVENAHKLVIQEYSWEASARRYIDIFKELIT